MFNIEKAHYVLDEMIINGNIVETNKSIILSIYILNYININF
jgi:AP-4 complex subunit sigma-1